MDHKIKLISLLTLFVSGWEENDAQNAGDKITRSWTGYLFQALSELEAEGMIRQIKNTRSVIIMPKGLATARRLQNVVFSALDKMEAGE